VVAHGSTAGSDDRADVGGGGCGSGGGVRSPAGAAARWPMTATSFGPSALATPANAVTITRLVASPVLWALILATGPSWGALALWIMLASTDGLDGWLARRMGTTRSGAFLDPLADKALVIGAMWAVVAAGGFWWPPVALITLREATISGFRSYWGRRGRAVPATFWAKVKTVVQSVVVALALFPVLDEAEAGPWVIGTGLWAAVALTLATGMQYVLAGSRATSGAGSRGG
jgi:CDP-diacylglycerol--glycerol-3-phosphate 3-phosphatidyltransferase